VLVLPTDSSKTALKSEGRRWWDPESAYHYGSIRRGPRSTTSVAVDDQFDAHTTEVPTEWNLRRGRDYEESISGYHNYVAEMESMLGGQVDLEIENMRSSTASVTMRKIRCLSPQLVKSPVGRNVGTYASVDTRKVHGRKASMELVEHRVMEDGPQRTVSLWRERVARSTGGSVADDDARSDANSHAHRRVAMDSRGAKRSSNDQSRRTNTNGRTQDLSRMGSVGTGGYERTEYMVAYHKPRRSGDPPKIVYPPSDRDPMSPRMNNAPLSPKGSHVGSVSPTLRRTTGRPSYDRTEYGITYPNTPPYSQGSSPSGSPTAHRPMQHPMSPLHARTYIPLDMADDSSVTKAASASSVELVLASCDPPLVHIAPVMEDLGIHKLEHLRAVNRLSEETRNREIKDQALRRGVTVMEWAILIDKVQSL